MLVSVLCSREAPYIALKAGSLRVFKEDFYSSLIRTLHSDRQDEEVIGLEVPFIQEVLTP